MNAAAGGLGGGPHILIVEDEYFLADDIARALRELGATVLGPISEVDETLTFLDAPRKLDGALLDINLHGEKIYPVAEALRQRGIPFAFATGYDQSMIPERFADVPRWEKPVEATIVAQRMIALLQPSAGRSRQSRSA